MNTPQWRPLHLAPRHEPVRLFLPAAMFEPGEDGRPKVGTVEPVEVVGHWDAAQSAWIDQATGARVFPSQWQPL